MTHLLTWREILSTAWEHAKKKKHSLIPLTLPYVLTVALAQTVTVLFYLVFVLTPVMQTGDTSHLSPQGDLATLYFVLKTIGAIVEFFVSIVLLLILWQSLAGNTDTHASLLKKTTAMAAPFAWVSLLSGLAVASGFMLFIIPGIFFSVWYLFSLQALLFDEKRGRDALRYSHTLVRGRFWPVSYRLGAIGIITLLLICASLVCGLLGARLLFFFTQLVAPDFNIIILGAVSIFSFFALTGYVMLFATLQSLILYRNLKDSVSETLGVSTSQ